MKNANNKNEINIFFDRIENFVINIIDNSFIEKLLNKVLICDNIHENDKQMIQILIENDKHLNFKHIRYKFLTMFFVELAYTIDNVQDKVMLKILSTFSINYIRPILSKKCRMYEKKSMIALEKTILTKINKKIKNVIKKDFEESIYNNDNFIKNVYLDSFNDTFTVYAYYTRVLTESMIVLSNILILIFFYPLLFKLRFGLLQNLFNIGLASIYNIFVISIFNKAKKSNINNNTQENELKNIIYSFFQNINIIVESNTLEFELNKVLKHVESIMYGNNNNGFLNKYLDIKNDPYYLKQIERYKLIDTGVSILINDTYILFFVENMKYKLFQFVEKRMEFYNKITSTRDLIDILNSKSYHVAKTIAWNDNHDMLHPNLFVLEDVTLQYVSKDGIKDIVLENINLDFENGSSHFLYGNSGSGKSSFLNALMKRIKIANGIIKFQSIYDQYTYFSIREYLTYITSESALFYTDLYYNITYGIDDKFLTKNEKEITEEISKYMTLFGLEKFISTMNTTNAHNLSKGQTQKIAIIRMFMGIKFKGLRILFLDEFTSNIDNRMEEIIYTELRKLQKIHNFTVIYVSHSLFNMKYSDYNYQINVENKQITKHKTNI
jgi:ABC-type multidrug transport system fused ATPase/permease subunit